MTEQEKYVRAAAVIFRDALDILNKRSKKYTGDDNPFANFISSAEVADIDVTHGIMSRFGDKLGRIKQGLNDYRNGTEAVFEDESFHDSLIDAINYLSIIAIWVETGGGRYLDDYLDSAGMGEAPKQQELFEALEEKKDWFSKLLSR